jgi:CheY-specific phosphatase CheX
MNEDIEKLMEDAVKNVFKTMLNFSAERVAAPDKISGSGPCVAGNVGLTGGLSGMFYIVVSDVLARKITCAMLQITDKEIEGNEMVNDVLGEISNMVAGHFKTRLTTHCMLTIPSVVRGNDFKVVCTNGSVSKTIYATCNDSLVMLEVVMKPS